MQIVVWHCNVAHFYFHATECVRGGNKEASTPQIIYFTFLETPSLFRPSVEDVPPIKLKIMIMDRRKLFLNGCASVFAHVILISDSRKSPRGISYLDVMKAISHLDGLSFSSGGRMGWLLNALYAQRHDEKNEKKNETTVDTIGSIMPLRYERDNNTILDGNIITEISHLTFPVYFLVRQAENFV